MIKILKDLHAIFVALIDVALSIASMTTIFLLVLFVQFSPLFAAVWLVMLALKTYA